ncbi:MAG TPA: large conductance mechanosensitive channel protein MscL [Candidatus Binatia bacterium]|nr:large conductance mechanosensitive channel protein MscL [Candidatus Binatia bacterium]
MLNEFKKFILRGSVVDLAVGVVIGAAFTSVVNSFVRDIITPLISVFGGSNRFAEAHITIRSVQFMYGDLIDAIISFLLVATVVFFLVVQPINKLNELAMKNKDTEESTTRKCPYCLSVIPADAKRCKFCTSDLQHKKDKTA